MGCSPYDGGGVGRYSEGTSHRHPLGASHDRHPTRRRRHCPDDHAAPDDRLGPTTVNAPMNVGAYDQKCDALFLTSCTMTEAHPQALEPVREVATLFRHALETQATIPSADMLALVRLWGHDAADFLGAATQAAIDSLGEISLAALERAIHWFANLRRALLQSCEITMPGRRVHLYAVAN